MKQIYFLLGVFASIALNAQLAGTIQVTFKVDMQLETVSPNGVHLYGSMQGYNPATTLMTNTVNDIYEVMMVLDTSTIFYYVFVNGNTLGDLETVPPPCNTGFAGSRQFTSGNSATQIVGPFCFESCDPCPAVPYNITFQVDMSQQTVSGNGVHTAGSWNSFSPSADAMTNQGGGIYTHTETLDGGTDVEYVFVNGSATANFEIVPGPCNTNGHRLITVPNTNSTLDEVCFGSCSDCVVGIADPAGFDLSIHPRVTSDYFTIELGASSQAGEYCMMDIAGRQMASGLITGRTEVISVKGLPTGMYMVVVRDGNDSRTARVMVQ